MTGQKIFDLIEKLFPINRSITGNGVRETLKILSEIVPLKIHEVKSGTKVLDWEVPLEWNIQDAWIKDKNGKRIVDFKDLNLHVLNYSTPIYEKMNLKKLKEHLFTLPENPDWVPYRTSYYNKNWGFCMSHNQFLNLSEGTYEVKIDSSLKEGYLTYGEFYIPGEIEEEVLISVHICHPSLANDNLSGVSVAAYLADHIAKKKSVYSYRFLFIPGTIGSITWLHKNRQNVKNVKYGLVLTLLGDEGAFNYKKSRDGNAKIDELVEYCLNTSQMDYNIMEFYPYGYDERQYCSPGFNMPLGRLSRSNHGEFPEYHSSGDNLSFIKKEKLEDSFVLINKIINTIEENNRYINLNPFGEPQLGKRGLFKKIGGHSQAKEFQMAILWLLNLSDGRNDLLDIAKRSGIDFDTLKSAADILEESKLLTKQND